MNKDSKKQALESLHKKWAEECQCELKKTATRAVPGDGDAEAEIIFIGEAPGKSEDEQGRPFVGAAGKFLAEMLSEINLKREEIYITNIVKYRPPNNRDPLPEEKKSCREWLLAELKIISPKLIIFLGRHALNNFFPDLQISKAHGKLLIKVFKGLSVKYFLPLYHPAAALYDGSMREILKEDFRKIPKVLKEIEKREKTSNMVYNPLMEKVQIIILAAGKGKRMQSDEPKALAKLKGKPFLAHILDTISELNLPAKPIIVVGHKKERIKEALGDEHIYAEQAEQLGTGHAVLSAQKAIGSDPEIILVISADQPLVSKKTIENIIARQKEKKPTMTIATALMPDFEDWRAGLYHFGRIVREKNGLIKKIVEFKDASDKEKEIKELNPALYAFEAKWLWNNIDKIKNKNAQAEYYLTDLIKMAGDQNKKIEIAPIKNILEALQPNSKEELEALEKLVA